MEYLIYTVGLRFKTAEAEGEAKKLKVVSSKRNAFLVFLKMSERLFVL